MDILGEANRIVKEHAEKMRLSEEKKAEFHAKVQYAKERAIEIAPAVIAATPAFMALGSIVTDMVNKASYTMERRAEKTRRERSVYDRSEMHYWNLKRKLTNKDWERINKARGGGKRLGEILEEMGLLK